MSVIVLFNGRRKVVKVEANTLVQDVIAEAAVFFQLDSTRCNIKHQRSIAPRSQLFRFSNIPNNAQVELVVSDTVISSSVTLPAKLAISIPNGGSVMKSVDPSISLKDVLTILVNEGTLSTDIWNCNPEIIYMRSSYTADKLDSVTLSSLGLAG